MDRKLVMLIVDDMEINRAILREIFESDYHIVEADNGLSALEYMNSNNVDIVILDVIMPVMDGIEFLNKAKSTPEFEKIPIVVNTELGAQQNEIKILELGADDFIAKPYNPQIVKRRVGNLIEKYILQRNHMENVIKDTSEKLDMLIDTVPGGICIYEITDRIRTTFFNDGLCELLGYSRNSLNKLFEHNALSMVYEDDYELLVRQFMNDDDAKHQFRNTVRMVNSNGELIWVGVSAKRLMTVADRLVYHVVFLDATEEKLAQKQIIDSMNELRFRAERDWLTRIYNRETFYQKTEEMIKNDPDETYILALWNIDKFKIVNELFGSKIGDNVLINFARIISRELKNQGTYGRLESDHFVTCVKKSVIEAKRQLVTEVLEHGIQADIVSYPIMVHIGLYEIVDRDIPIDLMCDRADLAIRTIKGNYIKRYAYYNESLKSMLLDEQELESEMEAALEDNQFYINLQPIYSAKTKKPVSAEALVRWNHPVRGFISPGVFIPIFERNSFITKLDMFVWEEVCKLLAENRDRGIKNVPVSVNVSRINFYNPELCNMILGLLQKYNLDTSLLKLEITESAYTDNPQELMNTMEVFKKYGFEMLMDDFGSGYSSLNMLKDVAVDIVKIDMKFIDTLETSEKACNILFNIIQMSKSLGMDVVAEGVETQNQYELLAGMGCDCIQGYYFSKPLPKEAFQNVLIEDANRISDDIEDKRRTVLVVDDIEISRASITETINDYYRVIEAENGQEALDILRMRASEISLIITDIMMPVMDGFELLEQISKSELLRKIPVLVITAFGECDNEIKAIELGAIDVITRPFEPVQLNKRIYNLMKISETEDMQMEIHKLREQMSLEKQKLIEHIH